MVKQIKSSTALLLILTLLAGISGCSKAPVPKPRGYFRIDLPAKEYVTFNNPAESANLPLTFEYPRYGVISDKIENAPEPGWFNIEFPGYKASLHLTYKDIHGDLEELVEQTYTMNVKNHITKADAINEQVITDPEKRIFGIFYDLKGNTATAVQFYVTDSADHYLRGSLYFEAEPNADSLTPVIDFFREDVFHLIETLEWKKK
ncbi:MAG TPA: gliding motility lipoprotein GldD [Bacteroidales bacterium]|nr:gliding motility lipoprotein GldD [Bacteroidales bacterium]